jgi:phosphomannomutase
MGEVKFSKATEEFITALGGEYIMNPTGFAFIKEGTKTLYRAIKQGLPYVDLFGRRIELTQNREPVILAAELSGHQMSGHEENWIFDDGALGATKVLTVIAKGLKKGKTFIDLDEEVPRYAASPELNIRLTTNILEEKQEIVARVLNIFWNKGYPIDTTDGGLIKWIDMDGKWLGQALIRKSNTQPMVICRVEGRDEKAKARIEEEFFDELSRVSTKAVPKLDLTSDDYIRGILPRVMESGAAEGSDED